MKNSLGLPTLINRRRIFRLTLFHKIYHKKPLMRSELLTPPTYVSSRVDHQYKVGIPNYKTNTYYNSFVPRTSSDWNRLSADIASIPSINDFKNALFASF